jgi:hypothetical protein
VLGVRQHRSPGGELVVLAGDEGSPIELAELIRHQILARFAILRRRSKTRELVTRADHGVERRLRARGLRIERAKHVDDSQMRGGIQQGVVFVLAVELDETRRQIAQRRRRRRARRR